MINKLLSIGFAAAISVSAFAQSTALTTPVPANVAAAFHAKYPNVSNVTWNQEVGYFQPVFDLGGVQNVGYIDLKGRLLETIAKVGANKLPLGAATYIRENYAGQTISEAGRIDFANTNLPSRFYAKVGGTQLLFDITGNFIKTTASPLKQ